jgi:PAS domain-containing protein
MNQSLLTEQQLEYIQLRTEADNLVEALFIANTELAFQNEEKEKRAAELIIANKELAFQNAEKEQRATELIKINAELRIAAIVFESQEGMMVTDANTVILRINSAFTHIRLFR